ncbi:hypothetical protein GCM10009785_27640 [Brooklawnia cerclae]|uniref:DUF4235 domain-containing protein n=1 Tax=Brooklawnia cerclae TaxID=349934 RepID=A0ABX0SEY3_9ACTN|nr:hypothetical protein [Brooklawnia cerclae]
MTRNAAEEDPMANMEFKIVAGLLGGVATFAAQKLISRGWTTITGQEPPDPDDPEASTVSAVAWVAASAVGVAVVQVLVRRFAAKRYSGIGRHSVGQ